MVISNEELEGMIYSNPLILLSFKDKDIIDRVNNYLPYSTGIEIECSPKDIYVNNINSKSIEFTTIPNIMSVDIDTYEQRFRIPNGIVGLICLYNISIQLKNYFELNLGSGLHYHNDCTDCYSDSFLSSIIKHEQYILKDLDSWNYLGTYNKRGISIPNYYTGNWLRNNNLNTLEYRIGEMTFDYSLLASRIIHTNNITRYLKDNYDVELNKKITYIEPNIKELFSYSKTINFDTQNYSHKIVNLLNKEIEKSKKIDEGTIEDMDSIRSMINNRTVLVNNKN